MVTTNEPIGAKMSGTKATWTITTPPDPFWKQALRWAAALLGAAALATGGWYALDRIDAAADRVVTAVDSSADRQVDTAIDAFNTDVDNRNQRIKQRNDMLDDMNKECFGYRVSGAIQQNGCFLQYIAALTGGH